jgi:hypothetical protein
MEHFYYSDDMLVSLNSYICNVCIGWSVRNRTDTTISQIPFCHQDLSKHLEGILGTYKERADSNYV